MTMTNVQRGFVSVSVALAVLFGVLFVGMTGYIVQDKFEIVRKQPDVSVVDNAEVATSSTFQADLNLSTSTASTTEQEIPTLQAEKPVIKKVEPKPAIESSIETKIKTPVSLPTPPVSPEPLLLVEKCKTARDMSRATLTQTGNAVIELALQEYRQSVTASLIAAYPPGTIKASDLSSTINAAVTKRRIEAEQTLANSIEAQVNKEYSACLNSAQQQGVSLF